MPVYEYRCPDCAATYEMLVRLFEPSDEADCPTCAGRGRKLLSVIASPSRAGSEAPVTAGGGRRWWRVLRRRLLLALTPPARRFEASV